MIVSIDIGTSYSSICILGQDGKAVPVDISTGASMYGSKYSLPSAVFVDESGNILVGQAAMNSRKRAPENFRMEFKRDLGQNIPIILGSREFFPKDLYTELFRHMTERAVKARNETIEKAWLTCPASFGKRQRALVGEAARAAGLFDTELIDEPTAAAMCYLDSGFIRDGGRFLVYDFGGGTFDVSLIGYDKGTFYSLADPVGLEHCGGIDIDRKIYEDMLKALDPDMLRQVCQKPVNKLRLDCRLGELAVKAKHHLSAAPDFMEDIEIGYDLVPYSLSRAALDTMISPLAGQTITACRDILRAAGLTVSDISAILMVGGTSRVPLVQTAVRQFAGNVPVLFSVDLELAVASGALGFAMNKTVKREGGQKDWTEAGNTKNDALPKERHVLEQEHRENPEHGKAEKMTAVSQERRALPQIYMGHSGVIAFLRPSGTVFSDLRHDKKIDEAVRQWTDIVALGTSGSHIVGVQKNGRVVAEGVNRYGQCDVSGWQNVASVVGNLPNEVTLALKKDGTALAAGKIKPEERNCISRWKNVVELSCGGRYDYHIVGLFEDGIVAATGFNGYGQCDVSQWRDVVSIACGQNQTVAIKKNGTVAAAGIVKQAAVSDWHDIISVKCGSGFIVGLCSDGTVLAAGNNKYGQCNVSSWHDIKDIACGEKHTVALLRDGTVLAVGNNECGQCDVSSWSDIIAVFCGWNFTVGVQSDGTILQTCYELTYHVVKHHWFASDEKVADVIRKRTKVLDEKLF